MCFPLLSLVFFLKRFIRHVIHINTFITIPKKEKEKSRIKKAPTEISGSILSSISFLSWFFSFNSVFCHQNKLPDYIHYKRNRFTLPTCMYITSN